ncbi:MAG: 2-oxoglutarate ferredoxin oxidoreductase subunit beta, 2-oxoglutarate ferredoxin oxidoreductase subunit beta [Candidatus Gottesmanbacteria bacterium GW2011_GWA2_43_14]|uniref:2-oxoglutarate ferredoxin oxidoreductase subunit beta, 2-oxoglutarate ferredoxin oxidoreductase subunit beta n=1 Tax=Candidatus Gottesmanbacteria bacterium GW2011_GWA2_43_14 TaxID=1618443 RepID=A0A0G1DFM3_9BACT|nr:MAG: 2-oxoglutarate ferredoxin oxidoreductase subunit beta, 2-oxoglutarate ferredoxin oxidoreductase subunit beta [Candidatus Gottesmanbacteria bacterium GW2011_GWA2_43_14]
MNTQNLPTPTAKINAAFSGYFPTWCPGCGNFGIWSSLKSAFNKLKLHPDKMAIVFGIGCSGNMNDFLWANSFHALHGRAVPTAIGVKIANHSLPVIVIAGDGDCYGEGGNHLLHAARGNHDITVVVHDNRVYGLTTGQVAPTAFKGAKSKSTPGGIIEVPVNPVALVLTQGATFIAQGFSQDMIHLTDLIVAGVEHKGFSLINVFQPCVTFNPANSYSFYRERVYKLGADYDPSNFRSALDKSMELEEKIPIGVIYKSERPVYTDSLNQLKTSVLAGQSQNTEFIKFINEFV